MSAAEVLAHALDRLDDEGRSWRCRGRREWISEDAEAQEYARAQCSRCPLMELCAEAAAELKVTAGTWAGITYPIKKRRKAAA